MHRRKIQLMPVYPPRNKVEKKSTWNAESVFPTRHAWDAELKQILADLDGIRKFEGRLGEGPTVLVQAFAAREQLMVRAQRVYMYAAFAHAVDTTDQEADGMQGEAASMFGQVAAAASFFGPELI